MIVVADASPLIGLTRIGQLALLPALFGEILIPPAVHAEVLRRPPGFEDGLPAWLRVMAVHDFDAVARLTGRLDLGEAEAVVLASEIGAQLLMDERAGRALARTLGLKVTGTVGVLLEAKQAGLLDRVAPALLDLERAGFRMSVGLLQAARRTADEL